MQKTMCFSKRNFKSFTVLVCINGIGTAQTKEGERYRSSVFNSNSKERSAKTQSDIL